MPRLDIPALFIDRCVGGSKLKVELEAIGFEVLLKHEVTGEDPSSDSTPDCEWIARAGSLGLVIVTEDKNILRNRLEREALYASGTWAFVLTTRARTSQSRVELFTRHARRMAKLVRKTPPPAVWRLNKEGAHLVERPS